jgi:hypothetical protein
MQFQKTSNAVRYCGRVRNYSARRQHWLLSGKRDHYPGHHRFRCRHDLRRFNGHRHYPRRGGLRPIGPCVQLGIRATCATTGFKITTGASVSVLGVGRFT